MSGHVYQVDTAIEPSKCRGCGADIWWVETRTGAHMPVNEDGRSHFETCPRAGEFSRRRPPARAVVVTLTPAEAEIIKVCLAQDRGKFLLEDAAAAAKALRKVTAAIARANPRKETQP